MTIARHKLLILLVAIICAAIAGGVGLSRGKHSYTASATLQVGQVNPNSPGFYSYVQSSAALATAFSRAITAEPVLATVQKKLGIGPAQAATRLEATPVPQSPAFRVIASGSTARQTTELANVAADALVAYEGESNSANPEAASLLHEYREASLQLRHLTVGLSLLTQASAHRHLHGSALDNVLAPDEADRNADEVRLKAIGVAYTAAVSSQAPRSGLVTLLAGATSASSSRDSKIEIFGFIGLIVGVLLGVTLAALRERRRVGRSASTSGHAAIPRSDQT
jgi:capsular polysaccharide biosynthesis protein